MELILCWPSTAALILLITDLITGFPKLDAISTNWIPLQSFISSCIWKVHTIILHAQRPVFPLPCLVSGCKLKVCSLIALLQSKPAPCLDEVPDWNIFHDHFIIACLILNSVIFSLGYDSKQGAKNEYFHQENDLMTSYFIWTNILLIFENFRYYIILIVFFLNSSRIHSP